MTLMNPNAYAHPSIMFAQWEGWDGKPVNEPPLFYTGLSELAAEVLSSASDEVLNVSRIVSEKSGVDTSQVNTVSLLMSACFKTLDMIRDLKKAACGNK